MRPSQRRRSRATFAPGSGGWWDRLVVFCLDLLGSSGEKGAGGRGVWNWDHVDRVQT